MKFPARLFATIAVVLLSGLRSRTGSGSREVRLRHAATGQSRGAADQTLVQATDLISAALPSAVGNGEARCLRGLPRATADSILKNSNAVVSGSVRGCLRPREMMANA